ncbi:Hypothetical predicted protein [Paramuricea clavata]|uniref:Uncharacterized protein n=1 Tax=Paramuricea clavata TaxID=317549 RepID=A0A6S7K1D4_PARCT|nr:Hypothetical predicted protein [Paramuricea clavata]
MGFALFFNIIAVIIASVASVFLILITAIMKEFQGDYQRSCIEINNRCICYHNNNDRTSYVEWKMKCSDIDPVYSLFVAALVAYIILAVTSFTASIFGCRGTCCAPVDPIVVVTAGVPVHTGGTVVVSSNQSSMYPMGNMHAHSPAYENNSGGHY